MTGTSALFHSYGAGGLPFLYREREVNNRAKIDFR